MDGNKDEALRCKLIAKEAIATGNKQRARKFVKMAQRLNRSLYVDDLLASCEKLETNSPASSLDEGTPDVDISEPAPAKAHANFIGERNNTDEHVQLIREIKKSKDYYSILGVERSCSVEEIKRAHRKLLLKVHPDKNRALGSEDAFKKVSNAFKCLSNEDLRRQYDQVGQVEEFEYNQQHNIRQRQQRRRTAYDTYDNDFDLDEIFRASFGHNDMFRSFRMSQAYRSRSASARQRENSHGGGSNFILLLQLLPFLIIFVLAYLPYTEPDYSLQKGYSYQFLKKTEKHGVDFFVKSLEFDRNHPVGSPARTSIEDRVIKDYKYLLGRYCHIELQRRHWGRNLPTPHCDRLQNIGVA